MGLTPVAPDELATVVTTLEMRERMSGNICRCGAYSNIAEAMADVAGADVAGADVAGADVAGVRA